MVVGLLHALCSAATTMLRACDTDEKQKKEAAHAICEHLTLIHKQQMSEQRYLADSMTNNVIIQISKWMECPQKKAELIIILADMLNIDNYSTQAMQSFEFAVEWMREPQVLHEIMTFMERKEKERDSKEEQGYTVDSYEFTQAAIRMLVEVFTIFASKGEHDTSTDEEHFHSSQVAADVKNTFGGVLSKPDYATAAISILLSITDECQKAGDSAGKRWYRQLCAIKNDLVKILKHCIVLCSTAKERVDMKLLERFVKSTRIEDNAELHAFVISDLIMETTIIVKNLKVIPAQTVKYLHDVDIAIVSLAFCTLVVEPYDVNHYQHELHELSISLLELTLVMGERTIYFGSKYLQAKVNYDWSKHNHWKERSDIYSIGIASLVAALCNNHKLETTSAVTQDTFEFINGVQIGSLGLFENVVFILFVSFVPFPMAAKEDVYRKSRKRLADLVEDDKEMQDLLKTFPDAPAVVEEPSLMKVFDLCISKCQPQEAGKPGNIGISNDMIGACQSFNFWNNSTRPYYDNHNAASHIRDLFKILSDKPQNTNLTDDFDGKSVGVVYRQYPQNEFRTAHGKANSSRPPSVHVDYFAAVQEKVETTLVMRQPSMLPNA
ncbi:hypothetical protein HDV05_003974 [Chytridiales sp. JEL 0842]|nr:hypothetical protein HDV05_003974 [Chytridiales sp. JEL 0842]